MRKSIAAVLAATLVLLLGAGSCGDPPAHPKPRASTPRVAAPPVAPNPNSKPCTNACPGVTDPLPGQQPPPPQADPGPYNDIHQVVVRVWWIDERSGFVTVLLNTTKYSHEPAGTSSKGADGKYHGGYLKIVQGVTSGDDIEVQWNANGAPSWVMLAIYHNGKTVGSVQMGQRDCLSGSKLCATHAVIV
jgi:hypothetical protein